MAAEQPVSDEFPVIAATGVLTLADRWDHFLARWGWRRNEHKVRPGLYALGSPNPDSPVLVTANYTLSFDALRSALSGVDAYILVLNTFGVNVWCAAGKGTFGTGELSERIETSGLSRYVRHRGVIVPQLGASGVAAHEVKRQTGFKVEYGPVRAKDLPEYIESHSVTEGMRQVRFGLLDRLVLTPIELKSVFLPMLATAVLFYFISGLFMSFIVIGGVLTGAVLFPFLLPYLPTKDFSTKGFILGALYALVVICLSGIWRQDIDLWLKIGWSLSHILLWPAVTGFLALNFTGSTPFTSRTGVRKEISRYVRIMAVAFGVGVILNLVTGFLK
jgi:hypothetical protein